MDLHQSDEIRRVTKKRVTAVAITRVFLIIEVISNRSIGLKVKAGRGGHPQEYYLYFEDWPTRPNTDIEFEGAF